MKRILDIAGDLRIAFWLLLAIAAVMWTGSMYAAADYALINSMNGVRIQDWFAGTAPGTIAKTWWVPALFACFTLLGINTLACTAKRVLALLAKRKDLSAKRLAVLLCPSIIHILFLTVLAGHFLTFTAIDQKRVAVEQGGTYTISGIGDFSVKEITHRSFAADSLLADRIEQSGVRLEIPQRPAGEDSMLEFLEPLYFNGFIIQLDMEKKKVKGVPVVKNPADENCNKASNYHYAHHQDTEKPRLYIVATRDPGLFILIPGLGLLILVMGWYFYQVSFGRNGTRIEP